MRTFHKHNCNCAPISRERAPRGRCLASRKQGPHYGLARQKSEILESGRLMEPGAIIGISGGVVAAFLQVYPEIRVRWVRWREVQRQRTPAKKFLVRTLFTDRELGQLYVTYTNTHSPVEMENPLAEERKS